MTMSGTSFSGNGTYWTQLNKGTKSVIEIGPNYGNIYGLRVGAGSRSGAPRSNIGTRSFR